MKVGYKFAVAIAIGCVAAVAIPGAAQGSSQQFPETDFTEAHAVGAHDPCIEEGVTICDIDVSGMTEEEAGKAVEEYFQELADSRLTVLVDEEKVVTTWKELGLNWQPDEVLDEAIALGKGTGWVGKYKAMSDMGEQNVQLTVPYEVKSTDIRKFVMEELEVLDRLPVDASITRESGEFVVTEHVTGLQVDANATVEAIRSFAQESITEGNSLEAVTEVIEPAIMAEDLQMIQDVLGSCTTNVSGTADRVNNVTVGAKNINGKLLMPGESASASDMMKKRTKENGYKKAPQYANGQSVDAYGGGVCQVSSTLYNALLRSELQIDERYPHSMVVSYLDPSMDAAIADGHKDLKFTNNTEYPIYIEAYCKNRKVTFNVYGVETRPENRKVKFESHTTYRNQPADIVRYDASKPVGYQASTGVRHPNVKSYLEKVVYVDGKEVSRERLHSDQYMSSVKTIVYGSKAVAAGTTAANTAAAQTKR